MTQHEDSGEGEKLVGSFVEYLDGVRGTVPATQGVYARHARQFLEARWGTGSLNLRALSPRDIYEYVADYAARRRLSATKSMTTGLRSFLRFLAMRGDCEPSLAAAVPTVPRRRLSSIPKVCSDEDLCALLRTFDRTTATGLRDRAITLCLVHLGLRAGEIARITLDDIDWRAGVLKVATVKGRRVSALPLPLDVGSSFVAYLRGGRPPTSERHLFVQHARGRKKGIPLDATGVRAAVRRAWKRAGVAVCSMGTHALRHTLASRMLRGGADLKQVADVLRHRCLDTTMIYTKIDLGRLAEVAQPWPEGPEP